MAIWWLLGAIGAGAAVGTVTSKAVQRRMRAARDDHSNRPALWNRFYAIDWGDTTTNNYGFAPAEGHHPQRFQHQMYRELFRRGAKKREFKPGLKLLEVSCGRGGGLNAALADYPGMFDATGLDVAASAVEFCRKTYGENDRLHFVEGSAMELPFPDATFDMLLNVEASNDYPDRDQFFSEVRRVLKPDGIFLYTDSFRTEKADAAVDALKSAGFEAKFDDITANVAEACRIDSPRRREVIRSRAPLLAKLFLGKQLDNYAAVEGSRKYDAFRSGRRTYLMTAAERA
jgi:ubiquinone/menaquinone biosynthesis C-methylase UbiE